MAPVGLALVPGRTNCNNVIPPHHDACLFKDAGPGVFYNKNPDVNKPIAINTRTRNTFIMIDVPLVAAL